MAEGEELKSNILSQNFTRALSGSWFGFHLNDGCQDRLNSARLQHPRDSPISNSIATGELRTSVRVFDQLDRHVVRIAQPGLISVVATKPLAGNFYPFRPDVFDCRVNAFHLETEVIDLIPIVEASFNLLEHLNRSEGTTIEVEPYNLVVSQEIELCRNAKDILVECTCFFEIVRKDTYVRELFDSYHS